MGRIYIVLSDEVERRLRLAVVTRLGGKKGDLSSAIQEAVVDWLKKDTKSKD
ncbi:MAG: ribbon-helix-helix domain-containing protein [Candidatus Bathyarchaeia archaeon]